MTTINAYPLQWPEGWKRTPAHQRRDAKFSYDGKRLSIAIARERVLEQLGLFKVNTRDDVVLSTNLKLNLSGLPRGDQGEPSDPGAAVYWRTREGELKSMGIDHYRRVADNIAAIAASLDAMRAIDRHGGAQVLERAFKGFSALPPPATWRRVMDFGEGERVTTSDVESRYKALSKQRHPDIPGGSSAAMAALNVARDEALKEISGAG